MTEEAFVLLMLVIVMLVGSYLAGSIPLVMKLSERKLNFVTVLGAGLLVGTALTVIIPEGIRSLYMDSVNGGPERTTHRAIGSSAAALPTDQSAGSAQQQQHHHDDSGSVHVDHSRIIGLSLVLGFVFMMLVDQLSQQHNKSTATTKSEKNITATLGLVVHAAADGVALGAAATTSQHDVEIIVFLAIMLHKAPAAFGLVSFLLHEKIERQQIRKHLIVFSLSAPLLTLLTYFGIGQEQKETLNSMNATGIAMLFSAGTFLYVATVHVLPELTQRSSGDGGAHHRHHGAASHHSYSQYEYRALNEPGNGSTTVTADADTNVEVGAGDQEPKSGGVMMGGGAAGGLRCSELITLICGALLPLVITFGHSH